MNASEQVIVHIFDDLLHQIGEKATDAAALHLRMAVLQQLVSSCLFQSHRAATDQPPAPDEVRQAALSHTRRLHTQIPSRRQVLRRDICTASLTPHHPSQHPQGRKPVQLSTEVKTGGKVCWQHHVKRTVHNVLPSMTNEGAFRRSTYRTTMSSSAPVQRGA